MMEKTWQFPPNGGGEFVGFNNGALDHFQGQRLSSTVREVIQNSLDARKNKKKPMRVQFKIEKIEKTLVPEITHLKPHLEACKKTAQDQDLEVAINFYEKAIKSIEQETTIKFLLIHDNNSDGLTGPIDGNRGAWAALVKGTGVSQKPGIDSLGSFGHGSKAPFSLSDVRSIFYLSYVQDGKNLEKRFQGKSILQSHTPLSKTGLTQGTGYFGWASSNNCAPLLNDHIPDWATKMRDEFSNESGTTLIVPYFQLNDTELPEMAISCIGNFYYAIKQGNLEVEIEGEVKLNKDNINCQFYSYRKKLPEEKDFIDHKKMTEHFDSLSAIVEPDHQKTQEVHGLGPFQWYLKFLDQDEDQRKRVAVARKDGMLIKHNPLYLERFTNVRPFLMFVCVSGEKGSALLKRVENPRHDDFEFDRIQDAQEREKLLRSYRTLTNKIRDVIKTYAKLEAQDEQSDSTMNKWFRPTTVNAEHGKGVERGAVMQASRTNTIFKAKKANANQPGDGKNVSLSGQGMRGGEGKKESSSGPLPGRGSGRVIGKGKPTSSEMKYLPLTNLRSIPDSDRKLKLIFDNPGAGTHQIIVEKVGEDVQERIQLDAGDGTFIDQISVELGDEARQEVSIVSDESIKEFALKASLVILKTKENNS